MSFFNTIRGLGRSKKNRNQRSESPTRTNQSSVYSGKNNSTLSLRRTQSPSKQSVKSRFSNSFSSKPAQPQQKPLFLCEPFVRTALVKGSFKTIVQQPKYVDHGEWLSLNIFETYTHLNQFYGVIADYVTAEKYPTMCAGPNTEYLWVDSSNRTVSLPAYQYIDYALAWISNHINDENHFPTRGTTSFPPTIVKDIKNICREMFRIFAHIYHHHFDKIVHLSLEAHCNSFFAHFISFMKEFNLIDRRELEPLLPLIENLEAQGKIITEQGK